MAQIFSLVTGNVFLEKLVKLPKLVSSPVGIKESVPVDQFREKNAQTQPSKVSSTQQCSVNGVVIFFFYFKHIC